MAEEKQMPKEKQTPKVSVIIPVYNAEKAVERCVDSVLDQEFTDFELLLMDDGSRDTSPAILDEYAEKDSRVRVVHKENSGVSATRNMALDMARGEWVQFLDADDWITKDATKLFVRTAEENDADMVIADFYRVVGENTSRKGDIWTARVITREEYGSFMMQSPADYYYGVLWNKLFRRDILEKFGLRMDESLHWCEDFIFNMEYVLHTERIAVLPVPVYYYVKTEGSLVQQGMKIGKIVQMKLNVIEYYNRFSEKIYDEYEYAQKRPEIYSFLIDYAHDDGAIPGLPGTKKLGEERVLVSQEPQISSCWEGMYYEQRMLDRIIRTASQQYGLDPRDLKLFLYLRTFGHIGTMQEAADYVGLSPMLLAALIERLAFRGYVKLEFGKPATAELTPQAKPVVDTLDLGLKDLEESELENMDEDVAKIYQEARALAAGNLRKRLER